MRALIIEDEKKSRLVLKNLIIQFCENIEVVGEAETISEGVQKIQLMKPSLVFLDIEFPGENGFEIFEYFPNPSFDVIFTTAYDDYALKAFKMSALEYLLKPIDIEDLKNAIEKAYKKSNLEGAQEKIKVLKSNLQNKTNIKLALPTNEGYQYVHVSDIIKCEAKGNYTQFHMMNEKLLVCKTLKLYEEILENSTFFRISRTHLININHIKKYFRKRNPSVAMIDGQILSISQSKKEAFLNFIDSFYLR